jgi:cyclase
MGMREFIEHELGVSVRYVINTHYHADHSWGNCFFPGATIIAHAHCRDLLIERGIPSLEAASKQNAALRQVKIVLPHMTFSRGELTLKVGKKNLTIMTSMGHSDDGISVLVEEDRVLICRGCVYANPLHCGR